MHVIILVTGGEWVAWQVNGNEVEFKGPVHPNYNKTKGLQRC